MEGIVEEIVKDGKTFMLCGTYTQEEEKKIIEAWEKNKKLKIKL